MSVASSPPSISKSVSGSSSHGFTVSTCTCHITSLSSEKLHATSQTRCPHHSISSDCRAWCTFKLTLIRGIVMQSSCQDTPCVDAGVSVLCCAVLCCVVLCAVCCALCCESCAAYGMSMFPYANHSWFSKDPIHPRLVQSILQHNHS